MSRAFTTPTADPRRLARYVDSGARTLPPDVHPAAGDCRALSGFLLFASLAYGRKDVGSEQFHRAQHLVVFESADTGPTEQLVETEFIGQAYEFLRAVIRLSADD